MEQQSDTVHNTFQYQLHPTPEQDQVLELVLWRCRTLYNGVLEQRKTWWGRGQGRSATYYQQKAELPELEVACPEYAEVHSQVLQDVLLRVERAYQAFFRRIERSETPGFPRFQGRNRYHCFTYPQYANGAVLNGGEISLSKIGRIPLRLHRPLVGTPKTVTISREANGWYVAFSCAEVPIQPLPPTGQETGIDLVLEAFATLADGTRIANPRYYGKAERRLVKAQRQVSRRAQGSKRRQKAVKLHARAHLKVRRQRRDFHHKTSLALVRQYDVIYHEDLRVANMVKNHRLAKSISDAGWAGFSLSFPSRQHAPGGKQVAVDPACTSQLRSGCGALVQKGLSVR